MLLDACEIPPGHMVEADVCIVGAGPAGVTLARSLGEAGERVCLLAGGGLDFDPSVQALYEAETEGDPYLSPIENRRRQFGGTSNMWAVKLGDGRLGVRHAEFDPLDFDTRDWIPHSGWPITHATLRPYYERAHVVCDAGPYEYAPDRWTDAARPELPLGGTALRTTMFHFGTRAMFFDPEQNGLAGSRNVDVLLNGHALEICGEREVERIECRTSARSPFAVRAKTYVVAAGGIESPRLLLAANSARGIGEGRAALGRYYMDHPILSAGHLLPRSPELFDRTSLYDLRLVDGVPVMGKLAFTEEAQREHALLNACIVLMPQPDDTRLKSLLALWRLANGVTDHRFTRSVLSDVGRAAAHLPHVSMAVWHRLTRNVSFVQGLGKGGWSTLPNPRRRYSRFELMMYAEQEPDPDNCVSLTDERDALGMPKAKVRWTLGAGTVERLARARTVAKGALERAGLGAVDPRRGEDFATAQLQQGIAHHMGATRMHRDAKLGVVDANCRVHGVGNLFVASSSVFPTGSYANPTLTIVALALRLADHLKAAAAR